MELVDIGETIVLADGIQISPRPDPAHSTWYHEIFRGWNHSRRSPIVWGTAGVVTIYFHPALEVP